MKVHRHPGHGQIRHADDWLMTYADTITLLLCLFVVLLALEGSRIHAIRNVALPVSADKANVSGIFQASSITPFRGLPEDLQSAEVMADDSDTEASDAHATPVLATLANPAKEARPPSVPAIAVGPITPTLPAASPVSAAFAVPAASTVPVAAAGVVRQPDGETQLMPLPEVAQGRQPARNRQIEPIGDRVTTLTFNSTAFFSSGSATLSDTGRSILAALVGRR